MSSFRGSYPAAEQGLRDLNSAIFFMVKNDYMTFVEDKLLALPEKVRRLLSHYGAVGGCSAGYQWMEKNHDAENVNYACLWEYWKGEEQSSKFTACGSIIHWNTAGNIIEALIGVAWIHLHHPKEQHLDAIYVNGNLQDVAHNFVSTWGAKCTTWIPVVEMAFNGLAYVFQACPWFRPFKSNYNPALVQTHLEALRLGFSIGLPFHRHKVPVFPLSIWKQMYQADMLQRLEEEVSLTHPF